MEICAMFSMGSLSGAVFNLIEPQNQNKTRKEWKQNADLATNLGWINIIIPSLWTVDLIGTCKTCYSGKSVEKHHLDKHEEKISFLVCWLGLAVAATSLLGIYKCSKKRNKNQQYRATNDSIPVATPISQREHCAVGESSPNLYPVLKHKTMEELEQIRKNSILDIQMCDVYIEKAKNIQVTETEIATFINQHVK
jgi:hypothetical protein